MQRHVSDRRLLKLADFLDQIPPERFDYSDWVGKDWQGAQDLSCGTTACALGWAATMPEFRRLGLRLTKKPASNGHVRNIHSDSYGTAAAMHVFGLTHLQARFLFVPGEHNNDYDWDSPGDKATAQEVADHIRRFVKERV